MKQLILQLFLGVVMISANAQAFRVTGKIQGLPDGSPVYMVNPGSEQDTLASGTVNQGMFQLTGSVPDVDTRFLVFPSVNQRMVLFMGNEELVVNAVANDVYNGQVNGGMYHKDYEDFLIYVKPINDLVEYYKGTSQAARTTQARDSLKTALSVVYNIYQNTVDRFISRKSNSPMAAMVLAYSWDTDLNKDAKLAENRLNQLGEVARNSKYGKHMAEVLASASVGSIGSKALDFTQNDVNGKPVSLSQFKGKYVLVDFWAAWCRPCRAENPNVVAAYNKYRNNNFTVLGVSLDQNKEAWLQAIKADNLTWTNVSDLKYWNNQAAQLYRISSIPQNLLIDPNGIIIGKNLRGPELLAKLEEVLPKKQAAPPTQSKTKPAKKQG